MSDLEIDGFLAKDITQWIEKHRTENKAWFSLAEEINRFAQEQMLKLDIHNKDYQELLVAAGLFRAVSSFQGTFLLLERGMIFEAGTQLAAKLNPCLWLPQRPMNVSLLIDTSCLTVRTNCGL